MHLEGAVSYFPALLRKASLSTALQPLCRNLWLHGSVFRRCTAGITHKAQDEIDVFTQEGFTASILKLTFIPWLVHRINYISAMLA